MSEISLHLGRRGADVGEALGKTLSLETLKWRFWRVRRTARLEPMAWERRPGARVSHRVSHQVCVLLGSKADFTSCAPCRTPAGLIING